MATENTRLEEFSCEGLKKLGGGAEGTVYALDEDRILKVYRNTDENQVRRWYKNIDTVDECGSSCAKTFGMVRAGEGYGIIFERLRGRNLGWTIHENPDKLEYYAEKMGLFLKKINTTEDKTNTFDRISDRMLSTLEEVAKRNFADAETIDKIGNAFKAINERNTLLHSDFHEGNVVVAEDDELVLIDLDRVGTGHPIHDLIGNYMNHDVLIARNPEFAGKSWGLDADKIVQIKDRMLRTYFGTEDEAKLNEYHDIVRDAFLLRSTLLTVSPMFGMDDDAAKAYIKNKLELLSDRIIDLPEKISTLPV